MIDETKIEAAAIHEEMEKRLAANPDIQDFMLMTHLSDYEKARVFTMLRAAVIDGFRAGLLYQWELRELVKP